MDELKDIITSLLQKKSGLYIALSNDHENTSFYMAVGQEYAGSIDMTAFAEWLKERGLRAGGKGTSLQGSGKLQDAQFRAAIKQWVEKNRK